MPRNLYWRWLAGIVEDPTQQRSPRNLSADASLHVFLGPWEQRANKNLLLRKQLTVIRGTHTAAVVAGGSVAAAIASRFPL